MAFSVRTQLQAATLIVVSTAASTAFAQDPASPYTPLGRSAIAVDRPHSLVEIGVGALSLPRANICILAQGCADSDLTLLGSLRYLVRWNRRFAAGAGVSLGFRPVTDRADIVTESSTIRRSHSRNYYMLTGMGRYYALNSDTFDFWVGGSAGLVIIADFYDLDHSETVVVNPRSTTIATQGPMIGLSVGGDWAITNNFSIGAWTHEMLWFLPESAACAATNDCATLVKRNFSLELGVSLTYKTRLLLRAARAQGDSRSMTKSSPSRR